MRPLHHPDTETEVVEVGRFYERRVPTLDEQFLDAVDRATGVIQKAPERCFIIYR